MKVLLAVLLLSMAFVGVAAAHVTSTGLAVLDVDDGRLTYRLTLVATEQEEDIGRALLAAAEGNGFAAERIAQALRDYVRFSIAGVACAPGRIAIVFIRDPFPDIARQIQDTVRTGAGGIASHARGPPRVLAGARAFSVEVAPVRARAVGGVAPGKFTSVRPARGFFPFGFRGQPAARERAESAGIVPGHLGHRQISFAGQRGG